MNKDNLNIYNNLIKLTRNKSLYKNIDNNETFSDRLIIFLIHFAFFLKIYKKNNSKILLQEIYDFNFKQLEISIREIGYGDMSINKKMKQYINIFHSIIPSIENWENLTKMEKSELFKNLINNVSETQYIIDYFEKYRSFLLNNTLNSFKEDIIELKI